MAHLRQIFEGQQFAPLFSGHDKFDIPARRDATARLPGVGGGVGNAKIACEIADLGPNVLQVFHVDILRSLRRSVNAQFRSLCILPLDLTHLA